jgi:hypothetical protein
MSAANLIREIGRPDEGHQWDFVGMADDRRTRVVVRSEGGRKRPHGRQ